MDSFPVNLAIESWTLYTIGMVLVLSRLMARRMKLGAVKNLQIEDWLMVVAACTFTADIWAINEVARNGSNYMTKEAEAALTPEQAAMAEYGSKMTLALEMFTLTTVWLVKACLLLLYHRLTEAFDKQHLAVKIIAAYCVVGYVLTVVLCLTWWCRPIQEYWSVPVKYSQCATYYNHMIFATTWNVSSDVMLLCIPIPIIARSRLPSKRKVLLCGVLGLGALNILAAILNRYYNFNNPADLGYVYWYVGEVATAVYVGNIPLCWPLVRRVFHLGTWTHGFGNVEDNEPSGPQDENVRWKQVSPRGVRPRASDTLPRSLFSTKMSTVWDVRTEEIGDVSSQERIYSPDSDAPLTDSTNLSRIELTPKWHRDANRTTISTERGSNSGSRSNTLAHEGPGDSVALRIVRTVEQRVEVQKS